IDLPKKESSLNAENGVSALTFGPDGKTLVVAGLHGQLRFMDPDTGKELRRLPLGFLGATKLAFSPNGKTLAVAGGGASIRQIDLATGKPVPTVDGHSGGVLALALTP